MIPYYLRPRPGAPSRQTITPQPTEQRLSIAAEQLRANQRHLQQEFQIGHIAIGCSLSYLDFRFGQLGWRDRHPHIGAWHAAAVSACGPA